MRSLRSLTTAAVTTISLALAACASEPTFNTEKKPGVSPADLGTTYAWYDHQRPDDGVSDLLGAGYESVLTLAGDQGFTAKGYRKDDHPAMLVNWHLALHQLIDTQMMVEYYGYGPGWNSWAARFYPSAAAPVDSDRDEDGTLVIDVLRADTKELIWRGFGTAPINDKNAIPKRRENLALVVRTVLAQLPPAR